MKVHWEQAEALEPEAFRDRQGDRECGQDEDGSLRAAHHEPPELWGEEQQEVRSYPGTQEDLRELGHQVPSPAAGSPSFAAV